MTAPITREERAVQKADAERWLYGPLEGDPNKEYWRKLVLRYEAALTASEEENARLKAENVRMREEVVALRGAVRPFYEVATSWSIDWEHGKPLQVMFPFSMSIECVKSLLHAYRRAALEGEGK